MRASGQRSLALVVAALLLGSCADAGVGASPSSSDARATPIGTPAGTVSPTTAATPTPSTTAPPIRGSWDRQAPPPIDLAGPRAVLVGGQRVLVTDDHAQQALVWNGAAGTWHEVPGLGQQRSEFAAVGLRGGGALVIGGFNGSDASYSSVYAFDPTRETWAKAAVMSMARTNPGAVLLPDGRVLVAGGYFWQRPEWGLGQIVLAGYRTPPDAAPGRLDDVEVPPHGYALATAEVYDPASRTFSRTGSMRYARSGPAMTVLADGRVLVVGSTADSVTAIDGHAFETAEIWDPTTGRFTPAGSLPALDAAAFEQPGMNPVPDESPQPDQIGSLQPLPDGGALLVAHTAWWKHVGDLSRSFRFDASTTRWRETGATYLFVWQPTEHVLLTRDVAPLVGTLVWASRGVVVRAGGLGASVLVENAYRSVDTADAAAFNPATDRWEPLPPLPDAREWGAVVALDDGSALLLGGWRTTPDGSDTVPPVRFVPAW